MKKFIQILSLACFSFNLLAYKYSINLVFVNPEYREFSDKEFTRTKGYYPFGGGSSKEEEERNFFWRLVMPAIYWAQLNENAQVNIWFDFDLLDPIIKKNTLEVISDYSKSLGAPNLLVRNLRLLRTMSLENVKKFFDNQSIEVYLRADIARAIVANDLLTQHPDQILVYTDMDFDAENLEDKIDKNIWRLRKYSFLLSEQGYTGSAYENNFFIMQNNQESPFLDVHYNKVIHEPIEEINKFYSENKKKTKFTNNYSWSKYDQIHNEMIKILKNKGKKSDFELQTIMPPRGAQKDRSSFF